MSERYVTCETTAAITLHARPLSRDSEPNYRGHPRGGAMALCGRIVSWDTRIPVVATRCAVCRVKLRERGIEVSP